MWESTKPIPYKFQILGFIAEQGVVTIEDINRHFYPDRDNSKAIRVTLYEMGVAHLRYYSPNVKNGVWYIDKQDLYDLVGIWFPELCYFKVRSPVVHLIPHSLELNRIRTVLEQYSGMNIVRWNSENFIRSLPDSDWRDDLSTPKIPDALFWHKCQDKTERKFFLEYERTLKSIDRYREIFDAYGERQDVENESVIYICHTKEMRKKLSYIAERRRVDDHFQFVSLERLYEKYPIKKTVKEEKVLEVQQA